LQITKKWELALQKDIPQELHEVICAVFCCAVLYDVLNTQ